MWLWLIIGSAVLLGLYDVAKKHSLVKNDPLAILLVTTALTALFLCPWLSAGTLKGHLYLVLKAVLVTVSWISGMLALQKLPITIVSTFKASRPVFVLIFSILIYGERLNPWQWAGCVLALVAIWMLSRSGKSEGIDFFHNRGVMYMVLAVAAGVASALWDKHIMKSLEPLFVQSWTNVYVSVLLALTIFIRHLLNPGLQVRFRWDWTLLLIAVLITGADFLYFFSLHSEGALLSVVSMVRRSSVIITFVVGAVLFKEKNLRSKALDLVIMLAAMALIVIGSS